MSEWQGIVNTAFFFFFLFAFVFLLLLNDNCTSFWHQSGHSLRIVALFMGMGFITWPVNVGRLAIFMRKKLVISPFSLFCFHWSSPTGKLRCIAVLLW